MPDLIKNNELPQDLSVDGTELIPVYDVTLGKTKYITLGLARGVSTSSGEITVGGAGRGSDFTVDGVDDDIQINAAIVAAKNSTISKTVRINSETYHTSAPIILYPDVRVVFNNCIIKPDSDISCIKNYDQLVTTSNYYLDGVLEIDGTNVVTATNNLIEFIRADNVQSSAKIYAHDSGARVFYMQGCKNGQVAHVYGDTTHDVVYIYASCSQINVYSMTSLRSISDGLDIRSSEGISVTNCNVSLSQRHGALLMSTNRCYVQGVFFNNNQENIAEYNGISLNKAAGGAESKNNIIDAICYDDQASPTQSYGLKFTADTADNNYLIRGTGNVIGLTCDLGTNNAPLRLNGTSGGMVFLHKEKTATEASAATFDIEVEIPSNSVLLGVQLRVDTALSQNWGAAYITGSTQVIANAGTSKAKNTKKNTMFDANAATPILTDTTNIRITGDAPFTATDGQMTAIVYYYKFDALASLA